MLHALILWIGATVHGSVPSPERWCAAATVYGEARGESELGQAMVAKVILNRVADDRWPNTICGVAAQHAQFAGYDRAQLRNLDNTAWRNAERITDAVLEGQFSPGRCGTATHFHNTTADSPSWARAPRMQRLCRVDNHIFYREAKP